MNLIGNILVDGLAYGGWKVSQVQSAIAEVPRKGNQASTVNM